ncbi:MAG: hypothetical protein PWR10_1177 [Halanaerobiales bacterium]|nr:hypothetical protein [Halanaerobiales bacterium]
MALSGMMLKDEKIRNKVGDLLMNMWMIVLFLLIGFLAGYIEPISKKIFRIAEVITRIGLIVLLAAMGAKIGVDDRIFTQLSTIGFQALMLALGSVIGSIFLVKLVSLRFNFTIGSRGAEDEDIAGGGESGAMTLIIIASVVGGILAGLFILSPSFFIYLDQVTTYALAALLLGVGVDIGRNKEILSQLKELGWQITTIPLIVAIGSIAGAVIIGFFLGLAGNEAAAVGAGFGWYSLSGILLAKIYSVELGSLAFLANVFRELLTIISLPFVVKYLGKLTGIAPGGATTMDVTLPLIKETAGEETVIPAFINGVILSALVPLLVPFLVNL